MIKILPINFFKIYAKVISLLKSSKISREKYPNIKYLPFKGLLQDFSDVLQKVHSFSIVNLLYIT